MSAGCARSENLPDTKSDGQRQRISTDGLLAHVRIRAVSGCRGSSWGQYWRGNPEAQRRGHRSHLVTGFDRRDPRTHCVDNVVTRPDRGDPRTHGVGAPSKPILHLESPFSPPTARAPRLETAGCLNSRVECWMICFACVQEKVEGNGQLWCFKKSVVITVVVQQRRREQVLERAGGKQSRNDYGV